MIHLQQTGCCFANPVAHVWHVAEILMSEQDANCGELQEPNRPVGLTVKLPGLLSSVRHAGVFTPHVKLAPQSNRVPSARPHRRAYSPTTNRENGDVWGARTSQRVSFFLT